MFTEHNENGLVYMRSDLIRARHAFPTRSGGVSSASLASLNLIDGHGDEPENIRENFRRVAALMGVGENDCAVTRQVHGSTVRIVTGADRHLCLSQVPYEADGIATNTPGPSAASPPTACRCCCTTGRTGWRRRSTAAGAALWRIS